MMFDRPDYEAAIHDHVMAGVEAGQIQPDEAEGLELQLVEEERARRSKLNVLGDRLQTECNTAVSRKSDVEERWLEDLRQYHGRGKYGEKTETEDAGARSPINITRPKTNTAAARLQDMLLPVDEDNWDINPTPDPELHGAAREAMQAEAAPPQDPMDALANDPLGQGQGAAQQQPGGFQDPGLMASEGALGEAEPSDIHQRRAVAIKRCDGMRRTIRDQLAETGYFEAARAVIEDAARIGTGILKGPLIAGKPRKVWERKAGQDGQAIYVVNYAQDPRPTVERTDPWNLYTDDAPDIESTGRTYERHLFNKKRVAELAKHPGFLKDQLRELLSKDPDTPSLSRLIERAAITNRTIDLSGMYEVWEYHGPIDKDDLRAAGHEDVDDDPLVEYVGEVWFSNGIVLKAKLSHLEGDTAPPYQFFTWEDDEASVWGYGIPYLMRTQARVTSATWQMVLDNAALSTGPMVALNRDLVEPADTKWEITARKIWWLKSDVADVRKAFQSFDIPINVDGLIQINNLAQQFADVETGMPQIMEGTPTEKVDTSSGLATLMNASSVSMKRVVKRWDDGVTVRLITRFYDWNMAYNPDESIKGDFDVSAKGSSALLVRDIQTQNTLQLIALTSGNPALEPYVKVERLLRTAVRGMQLNVDDVLRSEEEVEAMQAQAAQAEVDPAAEAQAQADAAKAEIAQAELELKRQELQLKAQDRQLDHQERLAELQVRDLEANAAVMKAESEREIQLVKLANEKGIKLAELEAKLGIAERTAQSRERAAEIAAQSKERLLGYETQVKARFGSGI